MAYWLSIMIHVLGVYNAILLIVSLIITTFGTIILKAVGKYGNLLDGLLKIPPNIMIYIGLIILAVAFIGFCGVQRRSSYMIEISTIGLSIIFLTALIVMILTAIYRKDIPPQIYKMLRKSLRDMVLKKDFTSGLLWRQMESSLKCCGVEGPSDWRRYYSSFSIYCCNPLQFDCTDKHPGLFRVGCFQALQNVVNDNILILVISAIFVGLILFIGMGLGFFVATKIREENNQTTREIHLTRFRRHQFLTDE